MNAIRAVGFDLWETLLSNPSELGREQERLRVDKMLAVLAARGFDAGADRVHAAHRAIWQRCQDLYWSADKDIPCRRQIEHFVEELQLTVDDDTLAELEHAYSIAAVELPPTLVDGAREVIEELHSCGIRLGLISNTGRTPGSALRRILENHGVADRFTTMVFSNEHGVCKPEPSIFEELQRGLGVASGEIVFVGDNLYADVHGAQRCGMHGVHFVPAMRGAAVAPPVEHGLEITPHATITELRQLLEFLGFAGSSGSSGSSGRPAEEPEEPRHRGTA